MTINQKRLLSLGFAMLSAVGVITTAVLSAKNAVKYNNLKKEKEEKNEEMSKKDILVTFAPAVISGGLTVASITTSQILSKKVEMSLIAACGTLGATYNKYKGTVIEKLGLDTHKDILKEMAKKDVEEVKDKIDESDGRVTYWEEHVGVFRAKPELVTMAYSNMIERIQSAALGDTGISIGHFYSSTLEEFFDDCDAVFLEKFDKSILSFGYNFDFLSDVYSDTFVAIEINENKDILKDQIVYEIKFDKNMVMNASNMYQGGNN